MMIFVKKKIGMTITFITIDKCPLTFWKIYYF